MKVQNSIAFVTGANRGLGLAFASELVARGAAAARCGDATLLVNNAGIVRLGSGALDPALIDTTREIFETNFYGMMRATQAFAPALSANGGGAIINVLSDATWFARPMLAAYSATKSAAWSFTNALRIELREKGTQVLALHVGFLDTDMTKGFNMKKNDPRQVAARTLDGLENGDEEVIADEETNAIKRSLSTAQAYYMNPPDIV
jgi:short-subunit dehydrogenase